MRYYLFSIKSDKRLMTYSVMAESETEARLRLQIGLQGFHLNIDEIKLERVYSEAESPMVQE